MVKKHRIPVGILFSTSGPYATVSETMLCGALLAIDEVNNDPENDFYLDPVIKNPNGRARDYAQFSQRMILDEKITHVVGCYTSSSRKEVVPIVEKYDALLWYPSHYEGFESSPNVVYIGAGPNQHVVPLAQYMTRHHGSNVFLCGSDYIWPWESNRVMSAVVGRANGSVVAEHYLKVGSLEVEALVEDIARLRPDFIYNTLIGESSYEFLRQLYDANILGRGNSTRIAVCSCTLSEPELKSIGVRAAAGHIISSVYFQSLATDENLAFVRNYQRKFGSDTMTCADSEATYNTVHILANSIRKAGSPAMPDVLSAARNLSFNAPQGQIRVDADNNHCYLTPRIGISTADANVHILATAKIPCKPDPYLASLSSSAFLFDDTPLSFNQPVEIAGRRLKVVR